MKTQGHVKYGDPAEEKGRANGVINQQNIRSVRPEDQISGCGSTARNPKICQPPLGNGAELGKRKLGKILKVYRSRHDLSMMPGNVRRNRRLR